jgi:hypothetical protein
MTRLLHIGFKFNIRFRMVYLGITGGGNLCDLLPFLRLGPFELPPQGKPLQSMHRHRTGEGVTLR